MDARRRFSLLLASFALAILGADGPRSAPPTPEEALASFQVAPGLRVELVASEPLVESPVAIAFDERGRLFVAEDRGYPTGPGAGKPPAGRIALLLDDDGDGRMDRRTDFADGLTFPNGVLPWDGGLIVTCAPDILFLRDLDGDGRSDERRVFFTGFSTSGSTQLRASHPTLGPDGWIYVAGGLTGGKVVCPSQPDRSPVEFRRADFRFRPDLSAWESVDGGAQFGLTFDDFGRRFFCYNRVQVQHAVIDSATLRRNPKLAFAETVQNCPVDLVAEPLKGHGASARIYPISGNVTTADSHAGTFTAACGLMIYRGSGLPEIYRRAAFSCDPTGNLVHVDRIEPKGATFEARAIHPGSEFLASRDDWCRPVALANGPDGALYVVDMVRKTIEHPDYLPDEIRKRTDFESGKNLGRIWRVTSLSAGEGRERRRHDLAGALMTTLVSNLRSPEGWRVDTAQRLLIARRDPASVEPLRALVIDPGTSPVAVVRSIWLLESLGALDDATLRVARKHPEAPVRETALTLAEPRMAGDPSWIDHAIGPLDEPDPRVRFREAIAIGAMKADARKVLGKLATTAALDGGDRWARAAVFSSLSGREVEFLDALADRDPDRPGGGPLPLPLLEELGKLIGSSQLRGSGATVGRMVLAKMARFDEPGRVALVSGFVGTARDRLTTAGTSDPLSAALRASPEEITPLVEAARRLATDAEIPIDSRRLSIALLGDAGFDRAGATLLGLLEPAQPPEIRSASARALADGGDDRAASSLLDRSRFAAYTPVLREAVISALLARPRHVAAFLSGLEDGRVPVGTVDPLQRRRLTEHRDPEIRRRAGALFGPSPGDRGKMYESLKEVARMPGDSSKGRVVFGRECASCHRLDREGFAVGPDLFGVRNQTKEAILLHVLDPDREITPGFASYTIATKDGRVFEGLIASETATSLTLKRPLGQIETILRDRVEAISSGDRSLMPSGLEAKIDRREFADLLAYLKGEGPSTREDAR